MGPAIPELDKNRSALALDVGDKRIGLALANIGVGFASPLLTLAHPDDFVADVVKLCKSEDVAVLVLGLPRSLSGDETAQTARVRRFADELQTALADQSLEIPLYWTDEALTSVKAKAELHSRSKSGSSIVKADVDALAATYILEDFFKEHHA